MENPIELLPEGEEGDEEIALPDDAIINKEPRTPSDSPILRSATPNGQSCPVCLGPIDNVSFTDTCAHEFCFSCLVQWSRVKPECPLCKRRFQVIMYNVKSAIDFSRLPVSDIEPERSETTIDLADLRLFRYPTTMVSQSDFIRRNQNREVAAIRRRLQQMIDEMRQRSLEHMRLRLYRNRLKSVVPGNGRIREATPNFFRRYPASIHRLVPFLSRELRVLFDNDNREVKRMLNLVNSLLPRYPIISEEFVDAVRPFLGSRAKRFCQELFTFAKCPYDLAGFDRNAIYESDSPPIDVDAEPDPPNIAALIGSPEFNPNLGVQTSFAEFGAAVSAVATSAGPSTSSAAHLPSLSSVDSYTIEISSDSSDEELQVNDISSWVEVPTVQRYSVIAEAPPVMEAPHSLDNNDESSDSDCQIVGFDKPWDQRTPVNLTSDSEIGEIDIGGSSSNSRRQIPRNEEQSCFDLRKRHQSSESSSSSSGGEFPSPSVLAARGKRWSPRSLLEATSSSRSSFFPTLFASDVNAADTTLVSNSCNCNRTLSLSSSSSSDTEVEEFECKRRKKARSSRINECR